MQEHDWQTVDLEPDEDGTPQTAELCTRCHMLRRIHPRYHMMGYHMGGGIVSIPLKGTEPPCEPKGANDGAQE